MDITREVPFIKEIIKYINAAITGAKAIEQHKERDIAILKLKESKMWLNELVDKIENLNK